PSHHITHFTSLSPHISSLRFSIHLFFSSIPTPPSPIHTLSLHDALPISLYRVKEYAKAGLPMLPVTHGSEYTRLMIVLYTAALFAVTLLPFAIRLSGLLYLAAALALGIAFFSHALALYRRNSDALARGTFRFSI